MKKLLLILCLSIGYTAYSQMVNIGTITVNRNVSATFNFPDSVLFVVATNNPKIGEDKFKYYDIFKYENICIIRGNDPLAPETSINIKTVSGIYLGMLKYGESTNQSFNYDSSQIYKKAQPIVETKNETIKEEIKENKLTVSDSLYMLRLNSLLAEKAQYNNIGTIENGMTFKVANMKNDSKYTYIKVVVYNKTGSDYSIDGVFFKFTEGKRKGIKSNEVKIEERLKIAYQTPIKTVPAYKTLELGFVVESFTGNENGTLSIQFRDAKGTRNPVIDISGNVILGVKVFEDKY